MEQEAVYCPIDKSLVLVSRLQPYFVHRHLFVGVLAAQTSTCVLIQAYGPASLDGTTPCVFLRPTRPFLAGPVGRLP